MIFKAPPRSHLCHEFCIACEKSKLRKCIFSESGLQPWRSPYFLSMIYFGIVPCPSILEHSGEALCPLWGSRRQLGNPCTHNRWHPCFLSAALIHRWYSPAFLPLSLIIKLEHICVSRRHDRGHRPHASGPLAGLLRIGGAVFCDTDLTRMYTVFRSSKLLRQYFLPSQT